MAETTESDTNRKNDGKFGPGNCANPGGRPKIPKEIKEAFQALVPKAIETLKYIMENNGAKDADRVKAADIICNRAYGKPEQAVELSGPGDLSKIEFQFVTPPSRPE